MNKWFSLRKIPRKAEAQVYKEELAQLQKQTNQDVQQAQAKALAEVGKYKSEYAGKLPFVYRYRPAHIPSGFASAERLT